jgi:hypothetical protein
MVAKGNKDSHRYTYSGGIKAQETEKWGSNKARERYGSPQHFHGAPPPKDTHGPQKLGDADNLQGPGYRNDHREDWIRGFKSAESRPGYYRSKR